VNFLLVIELHVASDYLTACFATERRVNFLFHLSHFGYLVARWLVERTASEMRSQIPYWQFYVSVTVFVYGWLPGGEFAKKEAFVHIHAGRSNNPDEISPLHWIIFDRSLRLLVGRIEERIAFLPNPTPSCAVEVRACRSARTVPWQRAAAPHGRGEYRRGRDKMRPSWPGGEAPSAGHAAARRRGVLEAEPQLLPRRRSHLFPWAMDLCYVRNFSNFDR